MNEHHLPDGTKAKKQSLKLRRQKWTNLRRFARVIINVALTLFGNIMPPKLDYCFIISILVLFLSLFRQKQPTTQPQLFLDTPTILTTRLDCKSAHVQTLKWVWQQTFEGRNLASNVQ